MTERRGSSTASGAWRRTVTAGASVLLVGSALATGAAAVATSAAPGASVSGAVASDGVQANATSHGAVISAAGRYVAFSSAAWNLVPGDTLGVYQVFVRNLRSGTTRLVSVGPDGAKGNGASYATSISADGRYVVFDSQASDLVAGDTNGTEDVFVRDLVDEVTQRVSVSSSGAQADAPSVGGSISADGSRLAFGSDATNLVVGDTNDAPDVFVRNLGTGVTRRVSVSSRGVQADGYSYLGSVAHDGPFLQPAESLSADGHLVVFRSAAPNLVAGDTNHALDIFVRNLRTDVTRRVSVNSSGQPSNASSHDGSISENGRYVTFSSFGSNLVPGDTNRRSDIFLRDLKNHVTRRLTVGVGGTQTHISTYGGSISADGRAVTFASRAANLVRGDTFDGTYDIFVRNWSNHVTRRLSVSSTGVAADGSSVRGATSEDGRFIAFDSVATNLVAGDTNAVSDIFVRDRARHVTVRVSVG